MYMGSMEDDLEGPEIVQHWDERQGAVSGPELPVGGPCDFGLGLVEEWEGFGGWP
jgi:hypothetical protein